MKMDSKTEKRKKNRLSKLVFKIDNVYEIYADNYQYIVVIRGKQMSFFPSIYTALKEILDLKMKSSLSKGKYKNVEEVVKSLERFEKRMDKLLAPLDTEAISRKIVFKVRG